MALTVKQAAARLGYSEGYLYRLLRERRVPCVRVRVTPFREVTGIPADVVDSLLPKNDGEAA